MSWPFLLILYEAMLGAGETTVQKRDALNNGSKSTRRFLKGSELLKEPCVEFIFTCMATSCSFYGVFVL